MNLAASQAAVSSLVRAAHAPDRLTHLQRLEAESIHILREVAAEARESGPALLDRQGLVGPAASGAEGVLSRQAAVPAAARRHDLEVPRHDRLPGPARAGARPRSHRPHQPGRPRARHRSDHARLGSPHRRDEDAGAAPGARTNTASMRRSAARGATRRSRAPRSGFFRLRNAHHRWDPKRQRPEPWRLYNTRKRPGESLRVFPLSNWTELDVWLYIHQEKIPIVPLYFAAERPVVRARRPAHHGR